MKTQPEEIINVEDLDTFVHLLTEWHAGKVAVLEHMKLIPSGSEVTLNDGPPITMTDEYREGFIMGLTVGLMELGTLPFGSSEEPTYEVHSVAESQTHLWS